MTETKQINVAVLGATGVVGETIISILAQRQFPVGKLYALASARSAGETVMFKNKPVMVEDVEDFDFTKVDLCLFSAGGSVSKIYAPKAVEAGCVVIDNTSEFRYQDDVPLIVSEVNPEKMSHIKERGIIANPNCSTMQMLVALFPIHQAVGIARINVCTYQAVSGSGKAAMSELAQQTGELLNGRSIEPKVYPKQIAFNVLPHIDAFQDNGYTREEMKMLWETRKILDDESIGVNATAVRVPVFFGHSEAIHLETKSPITAEEVRKLLQEAPGVTVLDDPNTNEYPTPMGDGSNTDDVFVGRIRQDLSHPNGINLWIVADNVRKGAALNSVQIAELWAKQHRI